MSKLRWPQKETRENRKRGSVNDSSKGGKSLAGQTEPSPTFRETTRKRERKEKKGQTKASKLKNSKSRRLKGKGVKKASTNTN